MILLDLRRRPVFVELMLVVYEVDSIEGSLASAVNEIDLWRVIWDMGLWRSSTGSLCSLSAHAAGGVRVHEGIHTEAVQGGGLAWPERVVGKTGNLGRQNVEQIRQLV